MNDLSRLKLRELISSRGRALCDDPQRLEALLRDHCGDARREIHVLLASGDRSFQQQQLQKAAKLGLLEPAEPALALMTGLVMQQESHVSLFGQFTQTRQLRLLFVVTAERVLVINDSNQRKNLVFLRRPVTLSLRPHRAPAPGQEGIVSISGLLAGLIGQSEVIVTSYAQAEAVCSLAAHAPGQ